MFGALLPLSFLLAGAVLGWRRLQRGLASAWSRSPSEAASEKKAPYRQSELHVPIAGAARSVIVLVSILYALGLVGALRVGLTWVALQELIDYGHIRSGLVPADGRAVALQLAIAAQGLAMMVMLPRAARAYARRTSEQAVHARRAAVALVFGAVLAPIDARALYLWTSKPVIYWVQGMIADDVVFGVMSAVGLVAVHLVQRASRNAPPVAPAAIDRGGRSMLVLALEIAGVLATVALLGHAFLYATARYHASAQIDGEEAVPVDGKSRVSDDGRYAVWMPADTRTFPHQLHSPAGLLPGTTRYFTRGPTSLTLSTYEGTGPDLRTMNELCDLKPGMKLAHGDTWRSCEVEEDDHAVLRFVVTAQRLYILRAKPMPSPAADYFLSSFEIRGR